MLSNLKPLFTSLCARLTTNDCVEAYSRRSEPNLSPGAADGVLWPTGVGRGFTGSGVANEPTSPLVCCIEHSQTTRANCNTLSIMQLMANIWYVTCITKVHTLRPVIQMTLKTINKHISDFTLCSLFYAVPVTSTLCNSSTVTPIP